ncbi:hypothetical protein GGS23DRAFT_136118 [Durotheca rogersii]|uniref:uncharacterized protein n=1 Tax=Durotheca rogersii TaxID=419775 RepID=UPI00221FBEFB|nr:uncharacterized protein GGS23DRAFT_136118 [Durotheca rogersii]KAI5861869.1 hypothetical protein GGS23DRAFT_136118 [Durotheca rogersii]
MSSRAQKQRQQQPQSLPPTTSEIYHALLRPCILQILRAQGYYASTPGTIDALTELAGSYLAVIARRTAAHSLSNNEFGYPGLPGLVDVRLALEDCGALWPEREFVSQELSGEDDTRGVDDFIRWATGKKNQRIRKVAGLDKPAAGEVGVEGVEEQRETDYLSSLKRKHNKSELDSKYAGTILGRGIVEGEFPVEGGGETSLRAWALKMHETSQRPPDPEPTAAAAAAGADADAESRPASSGLSSLADEDVAMIDIDFGN